MIVKHLTIVSFAVLFISGCASIHGNYVPSCIAFEGDTLELQEGGFIWNRFTDQVVIDESGNKVDAFPDFPKSGSFTQSGTQLALNIDGADAPRIYHVLSMNGETYLLTAAEQDQYAANGVMARCALHREQTSK